MYLTQGIHRSATIKPRGVATVFGDRRRTWSEIKERVARFAAGLTRLGLERGDRVAVIAHNSDRYIEAFHAVWWAGGVIVPGNTRWALAEHIQALGDCGAKVLMVDRAFAHLAGPIGLAGGPRSVVWLDDGSAPVGLVAEDDLIDRFPPAADACGQGDDLAALFYTGGTTGRSKGVMLSHRGLISNFVAVCATVPMSADTVFLHSPPMFHLSDASRVIGVTILGATHVVIPFFSPKGVVEAVTRHGVTEAVFVPTMFGMLREYAKAHPVDFSTLRMVAYGASPISEALLRDAMELFPNAEFRQAYGQTELSPVATILEPRFHKVSLEGKSYLRSAGRAIVGVDVKVIDPAMAEVAPGQIGEIAVRSPGAMLGYWNLPELTASTLVDGWVRTGDAGYMDEDGFLYLVDRVKDMIVSGGENVFSAEVENAVAAHPHVVECAVIGVPDEKWGERVHAIVRLRGDVAVSATDIIDHCRGLIASYKCPRSVEFRTEPLPLSGPGKVLKTELRQAYWPQDGRRIN